MATTCDGVKAVLMKTVSLALVTAALLFTIAPESPMKSSSHEQPQRDQSAIPLSWTLRRSNSISFWVAFDSVRQGGLFEYRRMFLLLDPKDFSPGHLRAVFTGLAAENKLPVDVFITAFSNKDHLTKELDDYLRRHEVIDHRPLPSSHGHVDTIVDNAGLTANYYRRSDEEFFNYRVDAERPDYAVVEIRKRSVGYTGDPGSDLLLASKEGDLGKAEAVIAKGVDLNARDGGGGTPLMNASLRCRTEIVRTLLAGGAKVNARDQDGDTSLTNAASNGCTEVVRLLIRNGADVNCQNSSGYSALLLATAREQIDTVAMLLDNHANVEVTNKEGQTPLMLARDRDSKVLVELLMKHGAVR